LATLVGKRVAVVSSKLL